MIPQKFSPQVTQYMQACGYKKSDESHELGILVFRKDDHAVQFWNDKIEKRMVGYKTAISPVQTAFKGFDGKDMFMLMLILHVMNVVNIKTVSQEVREMMGADVDSVKEYLGVVIDPESLDNTIDKEQLAPYLKA